MTQSGLGPIAASVCAAFLVASTARVRGARVLVTRGGAGACVTSDNVTPGVRSMVSVSMAAACVSRDGMGVTAVLMGVAETVEVTESVERSGSLEMITMSGDVSVRLAGAEISVARDRRQSVKTRWTTTKVRL